MLAGEAALPMNRDVHIFAVVLHVDDDLFHQVPDDLLAILVGRAGGVPERGEVGGERRDPSPLLAGELRRLFPEEPVVIVADLPLGPQRLLPPLLQGAGHEAVLRVDGPVAPFGVLGLVPGPLQPLFPVLVQAGAVPLDVLQGPAAQLQRGGFQGAKDLLRHEVVDRRGLEAEARLFGPLVEVPDATVIGPGLGPVRRLEATAAVAADEQAR